MEGNGQNLPLLALVDDVTEDHLPVHADNDVRRSDDTLLVGLVAVPLPRHMQHQTLSIITATHTKHSTHDNKTENFKSTTAPSTYHEHEPNARRHQTKSHCEIEKMVHVMLFCVRSELHILSLGITELLFAS